MTYTPTTWVDVPDPLNPPPGAPHTDAAHLNKIEAALVALDAGLSALGTAATHAAADFDVAGAAAAVQAALTTVSTALAAETGRATTAEGLKAPLASPALTGNPTVNGSAVLTAAGLTATDVGHWVNGVPANTFGLDGDGACDYSTGNVYVKAAGSWGSAVARLALYSSAAGVSSFNTRTGAVSLTKADVTGTGLAAADVGATTAAAAHTDAAGQITALGLGSASTHPASDFDAAGAASAAQSAAITAAATAAASANKSADTITDGSTNKAYTAAEKTKLAGVATGATNTTFNGRTGAVSLTKSDVTGTSLASTDLTDTAALAYQTDLASKANASSLGTTNTNLANEISRATTAEGTRAPISTTTLDLPDATVSAVTGQLAVSVTSNVAANGSYTSPALPGTVGTPAARWALKANSAGPAYITFPNASGVTETLTLLSGEVLTFRQKNTSGWGAESGNKPLGQLGAAWAILPQGWNAGWRAAKVTTAAGTSTADVMALTDSIGAGQMASGSASTDALTNGWVGLLRTAMGWAQGEYWPINTYAALGAQLTQTGAYGTTPWVLNNSSYGQNEGGLARSLNFQTTGSATLTVPTGYDTVDLIYVDYTAGTFTWQKNSGSTTTITCTGPGTEAGSIVKKLTITGLTAGDTLTFAGGSVNGALMISGASAYKSTGVGYRLARLGFPGLATVNLGTGAGFVGSGGRDSLPADKIAVLGGSGVTSGVNFAAFPVCPVLALVQLGINDAIYGLSLQMFEQGLRRIVSAVRRGNNSASIMFVVTAYQDNSYSDVKISGRGALWHRYKKVLLEVAAMYGCAVVDFDAKWGPNSGALGFQVAGDVHPTPTGHADMSATIAPLLAA